MTSRSFDELVDEALAAGFEGWDFSFIADRIQLDPEPWDYRHRVERLLAGAGSMIDLGTGGGEFVVALTPRPPLTVATEGWMPNVPIAARNLHAVGAYVVADEGSEDNALQTEDVVDGRLPFAGGTFDVAIDRHSAFRATEVARVLRAGGTFLTQQIGGRNEIELNEMLEAGPPYKSPTLDEYVSQLERAGLTVLDATEAFTAKRYLDVGAIVYNCKAIPWQFAGFDPTPDRAKLRKIHERILAEGSFTVRHHRYLLEAAKV